MNETGQSFARQYSQGVGVALGNVGAQQFAQAEAAPSISLMDQHLGNLRALNSGLYAALERTMKIADRLLGPEPQNIAGNGRDGAKDAMEPPVARKLTTATEELGRLSDMLHQQLSRLERL